MKILFEDQDQFIVVRNLINELNIQYNGIVRVTHNRKPFGSYIIFYEDGEIERKFKEDLKGRLSEIHIETID